MMLDTYSVQKRLNVFLSQLSIRRSNREQFAARESLGRAAFVHVYVRRLRTNDRVVGFGDSLKTQHVCAGAAENEIDVRVRA
jgi:hypothetical protein